MIAEETDSLPRLLYVGDVPVASTVAGAVQLYRLLQTYPPSHLRIAEGNIWGDGPLNRLANVVYKDFHVISRRLLHSRFGSVCAIYLYLTTTLRAVLLIPRIRSFKPETILTVVHGFSWLTADALARYFQIPLHLIVHDDWPKHNHLPNALKQWGESMFEQVYKRATSRLCVSPYMAAEFEKRYGVAAEVLYPCRAAESKKDSPSVHEPSGTERPLVVGYFGSITSSDYANSLATLADVLAPTKGHLVIYSTFNEDSLRTLGLLKPNIVVRNYLPLDQLLSELIQEVDALLVPMSFAPEHRTNMEISFPSKLTDYTETGLPLIIWGPSYSSAVRWARENPGVAAVISENDPKLLSEVVKQLTNDRGYRLRLGAAALAAGNRCFSHSVVTKKFHRVLLAKKDWTIATTSQVLT